MIDYYVGNESEEAHRERIKSMQDQRWARGVVEAAVLRVFVLAMGFLGLLGTGYLAGYYRIFNGL